MKWKLRNEDLHLTTLDAVITHNTGLTVDELINPKPNPFIENLDKAVAKVKDSISKGDVIHIVADYDCDGVMSGTILYLAIKEAGGNVKIRYPRRFSEGYGLSMKIIDEIDDGLIVTIDNGITAVEQIEAAKTKGLDVVIIDHHLRREDNVLPNADVIVDPNALDGSEFNEYCAAGLAYRFADAIIPNNPLTSKLVAFAGVATVADVMKLVGDNRNLVRQAITAIKDRDVTLGFKALLDELKLTNVTEGDFGFKLGPIVNASGRLKDDGPLEVFNLLKVVTLEGNPLTYFDDLDKLTEQAKALIKVNTTRQDVVASSMVDAYHLIDKHDLADKKPIILYHPEWNEGVIGIIAGHIAEEYKTPAIAFTDSGTDGILKGSARTYGDLHLKHALDNVADVLVGYGGHAGAAGLSVKLEDLELLRSRLEAEVGSYDFNADKDVLEYDLEIDINDVPFIIKSLDKFAPFGEGNPQVVFRVDGFTCTPQGNAFYRLMGAKKNHIKFFGQYVSAVGFDMAGRYKNDGEPKNMDFVGMLSQNWFMGKSSDQIEIIDYKPNATQKAVEKKTEAYTSLEDLLVFH